MQRRHGAGLDFAPEAVAHYDVIAFVQFFHESRHISEVVAVIRIPHDDEKPARAGDASAQCRPVAALRDANHTRPVLFRNLN